MAKTKKAAKAARLTKGQRAVAALHQRKMIDKPLIGQVVRSKAFMHAQKGNSIFGGPCLSVCEPDQADAFDPTRGKALFVVVRANEFDPRFEQGSEGYGKPCWVVDVLRLDASGACPDVDRAERLFFITRGATSAVDGGPVLGNLRQVELCGVARVGFDTAYRNGVCCSPGTITSIDEIEIYPPRR